jgi:hypothetical protein
LAELLLLPDELFVLSDGNFASGPGVDIEGLATDVLRHRLDPNCVWRLPMYALGLVHYGTSQYACMLDRARRLLVVDVVATPSRRGFEVFQRRLELAIDAAEDLGDRGDRFTLVVQSDRREIIW